VASDEPSMPAEHRRRPDDQAHFVEPGPLDRLRQHGEDATVAVVELRPVDLALQHHDLMAQGENLGVAPIASRQQQTEPVDKQPQQTRDRATHPDQPTDTRPTPHQPRGPSYTQSCP
jgi:hypothetical protein